MKMLSRLTLILALLAAGWGLAQGLEREMTVLMGEMFFQEEGAAQNAAIRLQTTVPYRVTFKNMGDLPHRVKFGRGLIVEEGVPFAYTENLFDRVAVKINGTDEVSFRVISDQLLELDLDPGQEVEMVFTLPLSSKGEWELGCFVIGHYEAGMRAPLVVE